MCWATFRLQFDALVAGYNKIAQTEAQPNYRLFALQQDLLVANARGWLKATLSAEGTTRFDAYVQGEKKRLYARIWKNVHLSRVRKNEELNLQLRPRTAF